MLGGISRARTNTVMLAAMLCALPRGAAAHDIPNDVTVQAFVKPEGERLHVMVRVPLKAIRDINFPERGQGFCTWREWMPYCPTRR